MSHDPPGNDIESMLITLSMGPITLVGILARPRGDHRPGPTSFKVILADRLTDRTYPVIVRQTLREAIREAHRFAVENDYNVWALKEVPDE